MAQYVVPPSKRSQNFFELLDLLPTIANLMNVQLTYSNYAGQDQSVMLMGVALKQTLVQPNPVHVAAFSQIDRCTAANCAYSPISTYYAVAYSARTDLWRYIVFLNAPAGDAEWTSNSIMSEQLFSHANDNATLFAYDNGTNYDVDYDNVAAQYPEVCQYHFSLIKARYQTGFVLN